MQHPLLTPLYDQLWESSLPFFQQREYTLDPFLHRLSEDTRRGLTLVLRPSEQVKQSIQAMLDDFRTLLPNQHYYDLKELHTTVLTLVSCEADFSLSNIDAQPYIEIIQEELWQQKSPEINYRGISASTSAVMVQGFPTDSTLEQIRARLRKAFQSAELYNTIDKRYKLVMAHSTVMRFTALPDPVANEVFVDLLSSFRGKRFWNLLPIRVRTGSDRLVYVQGTCTNIGTLSTIRIGGQMTCFSLYFLMPSAHLLMPTLFLFRVC